MKAKNKITLKPQLFQNKLVVKTSHMHGYGVFAGKDYRKGELIEECYFILTAGKEKALEDYYFEAKERKFALLTGFGSIYNHSDDPNADYTLSNRKRLATIKADRAIKKGEEIYITYGDEWFETRPRKTKIEPKPPKKSRSKKGKKGS